MIDLTTALWIILLAVILALVLTCTLTCSKNKNDPMKHIEMPPIGGSPAPFPQQLSLGQWYQLCQFGDRSPDSVVVENDYPDAACVQALQNGLAGDQFNSNEVRRVNCEKECGVSFKRYRSPRDLMCVSKCYWK